MSSNGDDTLHAALGVDDRDHQQMVLAKQLAQRLLVQIIGRGNHFGAHHVA